MESEEAEVESEEAEVESEEAEVEQGFFFCFVTNLSDTQTTTKRGV